MRILFLSQLVPYPLDAGPKVRSYHVLRYLIEAGHQVTLVAFARASDSAESVSHLKGICHAVHIVRMNRSRAKDLWHGLRSLSNREPFLIARDHVQAMHNLLANLVADNSFDAVHADQLWMAQYALASGVAHKVLDQHNAMYLIPQRMAARSRQPMRTLWQREARQMRRYEHTICQQFDDVVWVTDEDHAAVQPAEAGLTIPICVDVDCKQVIQRSVNAQRVTFVGGLHWPPNADGVLWFLNEVWPLVTQQAPNACLTLIGKQPPKEIVAAAAQPSVELTGFVESLTPYLAETAAFIVPLHAGGGMRVKILDAWSWGMPLVTTTIGAEGITVQDGVNGLVADSAETFAQAVLTLLNEPSCRDQLANAGRATVEQFYDWQRIYPRWDTIYAKPNSSQ